ncbi:MAG: polyphenol oxidase family protein [Muribaculaceae bacterium]|nr:polyphenol oxidase family protein [Muribaculaceae bacterium]
MADFTNYQNILLESGIAIGFESVNVFHDKGLDESETVGKWFYRISALLPEQTHSLNVGLVVDPLQRFPDTDALVTFKKGIPIGVLTADCVPVLIYAPDVEGVVAVHAGWKGTLGGIIEYVLSILEEYGADPAKMKVAFGPSISEENYEVDRDLAEKFGAAGFGDCVHYPKGKDGKPHIDLQGVNCRRLIKRGVLPENIRLHDGCSFGSCREDGSPKYYSHRRSQGAPGRNLTYIMLREDVK